MHAITLGFNVGFIIDNQLSGCLPFGHNATQSKTPDPIPFGTAFTIWSQAIFCITLRLRN